MKTTQRLSIREIKAHLESQLASGVSVINYCTQHNLCKQTFYSWRKRYESSTMVIMPKNDFLALQIEPSIVEENTVVAQIQHPNGCSISFFKDCTPLFLAETINNL